MNFMGNQRVSGEDLPLNPSIEMHQMSSSLLGEAFKMATRDRGPGTSGTGTEVDPVSP